VAKRPYKALQEEDPSGTPRAMEPFVLLRLAEGAAHGYELAQALAALGFARAAADPSVLYKLLRALEAVGRAASTWQDGNGGPPRRVYALTPAGEADLHGCAADLARQADRLAGFGARYRAWAGRTRKRVRRNGGRTRP
jgi:PadR family transcriptional regulator PadR